MRVSAEERLLIRARALMASLPLDEIDLLIIDEIGKEISGAGMDPNITGRDGSGYSDSLLAKSGWAPPNVFRMSRHSDDHRSPLSRGASGGRPLHRELTNAVAALLRGRTRTDDLWSGERGFSSGGGG